MYHEVECDECGHRVQGSGNVCDGCIGDAHEAALTPAERAAEEAACVALNKRLQARKARLARGGGSVMNLPPYA